MALYCFNRLRSSGMSSFGSCLVVLLHIFWPGLFFFLFQRVRLQFRVHGPGALKPFHDPTTYILHVLYKQRSPVLLLISIMFRILV